MSKFFTYEDCLNLQKKLEENMSIKVITTDLGKNPTMVSKEINEYLYSEDMYDEYIVNLRVLRFKITENSYKNIVTNLPRNKFASEDIKQLYNRNIFL